MFWTTLRLKFLTIWTLNCLLLISSWNTWINSENLSIVSSFRNFFFSISSKVEANKRTEISIFANTSEDAVHVAFSFDSDKFSFINIYFVSSSALEETCKKFPLNKYENWISPYMQTHLFNRYPFHCHYHNFGMKRCQICEIIFFQAQKELDD